VCERERERKRGRERKNKKKVERLGQFANSPNVFTPAFELLLLTNRLITQDHSFPSFSLKRNKLDGKGEVFLLLHNVLLFLPPSQSLTDIKIDLRKRMPDL